MVVAYKCQVFHSDETHLLVRGGYFFVPVQPEDQKLIMIYTESTHDEHLQCSYSYNN